jgi:hypothetical protein
MLAKKATVTDTKNSKKIRQKNTRRLLRERLVAETLTHVMIRIH